MPHIPAVTRTLSGSHAVRYLSTCVPSTSSSSDAGPCDAPAPVPLSYIPPQPFRATMANEAYSSRYDRKSHCLDALVHSLISVDTSQHQYVDTGNSRTTRLHLLPHLPLKAIIHHFSIDIGGISGRRPSLFADSCFDSGPGSTFQYSSFLALSVSSKLDRVWRRYRPLIMTFSSYLHERTGSDSVRGW